MEKDKCIIEAQLVLILRQFLLEQGTDRALRAVTKDASLERELGIDSLSKVELFHRIEKSLGLRLSDSAMASADTLEMLTEAVLLAKPTKKLYSKKRIAAYLEEIEIDLSKVYLLHDVLIQYAIREPNRPHIYLQNIYLQGEEHTETTITYGTLLTHASRIANGLIEHGIKPDDTIAIMLPTCEEFFYCFLGILLAGAVPVPIYPPFRLDRIEEYVLREIKILNNAETRMLITFSDAKRLSKIVRAHVPSIKSVSIAADLYSNKSSVPKIERTCDSPALIQYTSGSTGDPKGILLYHENILANIRAVEKAIDLKKTDVTVSWLPLYHDMGLMSWLCSLYFGIPIVILSPISFLNHPERWFWAIHYHRGSLSAAPNFAYELCVKRIEHEAIEGLDLSSWRCCFNGAEAVNVKTMKRFHQRFSSYGLKKEALMAVYGLAENTVGLAIPAVNHEWRLDRISRDIFEKERRAVQAQKNVLEFMSEGKAIPGHDIRIVDDAIQVLSDRCVGNIQFRGPSAMQGYYRNPKASAEANHDGWWETGDLGYMVDGELFVTGRKKDLIIKAGRNLHPESIEEVVGNVAGIRKGCVIAFGVFDPRSGTERIIIVAESKIEDKDELPHLMGTITEEVTQAIGVPPDQIIILPLRRIPKTSSGKLQRAACKEAFLNNELTRQPKTVLWQMSILLSKALLKRLKHLAKNVFRWIYTGYMWMVFGVTIVPVWMIMQVAPKKMASRIVKVWTKSLFYLSFFPLKVNELEKISSKQRVIYAANHFSYIDTLALLAILPAGTIFIGKKELLQWPLISSSIKKLGFIMVDRWDFSKNIKDTQKIQEVLKEGKSILIFPEGTFTYASGLRPFKTGAFQLSVDTETPICPIAIKNTRQFMRGDSILLSPKKVMVTVCHFVYPEGKEWQEVTRLRAYVRKKIASYCGEPGMI